MDQLFESAFKLHLSGKFSEAEDIYRQILSEQPLHVMAKHYLGVLMHQQGLSAEGVELIKEALISDVGKASRYNDLGNILVQIADFDNAITAFQSSLEYCHDDANVWNNLGSVLHHQTQIKEAEYAYRQALFHTPNFVPALNNLASLLSDTGQHAESSRLICLAYIQPPLTDKPLKQLAVAYFRLGLIADAAECYRAWLHMEPDNVYAKLHLAACTGENVPEKTPDAYLKEVFDGMSDFFEEKLVTTLAYSGPEMIAVLLKECAFQEKTLDVLDGGCGTGLMAPILARYSRYLIGVDISAGMLGQARARNIYTDLVEAELVCYLRNCEKRFDLVVLADTLIYFGELIELFRVIRQVLRPHGFICFTIEISSENAPQPLGYNLSVVGRYTHSLCYLSEVLSVHGLVIVAENQAILRTEFGQPIPGVAMLVGFGG
ncbi:tetratricopeptide repeat protein [Methylomonas sp. AM2-LC]|uniref:tetratricopeptide repeat protein n=1 Tax=Methylomonas sp. AM2-LC TaxID=3153301 RepID=UPI00326688C1